MSIIEKINEGIKESIKKQNQIRLGTLRMLKSKILAVDARCNLPDEAIFKLFKSYLGNLEEALEQAHLAKRPELVESLKAEIVIVKEFLPQALTAEETKKWVVQAISESGAKTKKDLGLVMKAVMKLNSAIDGKMARDLASQLLED